MDQSCRSVTFLQRLVRGGDDHAYPLDEPTGAATRLDQSDSAPLDISSSLEGDLLHMIGDHSMVIYILRIAKLVLEPRV